MPLKTISPHDLICMDDHAHKHHFRVELSYAQKDNLLFNERIYQKNAKLYLHKWLSEVIFHAANQAQAQGYRLVLYDGLRPFESQEAMMHTKVVKENPHWLEEPRLLSPPGGGAHPRGMAIDCTLEQSDGTQIDMGTAFDYLSDNASANQNRAHRDHILPAEIMRNRAMLDDFFNEAAKFCKMPILALPQEWWDYRLPRDIYEQYAPIKDADLPPHMRMM